MALSRQPLVADSTWSRALCYQVCPPEVVSDWEPRSSMRTRPLPTSGHPVRRGALPVSSAPDEGRATSIDILPPASLRRFARGRWLSDLTPIEVTSDREHAGYA